MATINRTIVLNTLIKHETLTSRHIHLISGVVPSTYTITNKGIIEGARLNKEGAFFNCLTCKIQDY